MLLNVGSLNALRQYGFTQSHRDYTLFTFSSHMIFLCVLIYVNDLIITGSTVPAISAFKNHLHAYFHLKDISSLKYFLGIEVARLACI